jgi:hypothetical protein
MTRPPYGWEHQQGSPYAEPVRPLHSGQAQSPYAYPAASPYAEPIPSPYAYPAASPYAEPIPSPYAHPAASPYAEPVRRPDYLRPRQRVQIPSAPQPRRWPWMVTAAVSVVVITIAVAVMFKNLSDPSPVVPKAGHTRPSATLLSSDKASTSPPQLSTTEEPSGDELPDDEDLPPDEDSTVEITPEITSSSKAAKPKSTSAAPEPDDGEGRIPRVRGRNAQDVQSQLQELGFTNIQLVPDDPASGMVLFAAGWKAVSVDPGPGEIVDLTDAVTVRCVPLN